MSATIDYYLSLNSPWTYMGSAPFAEIAKRNGATVNVKPAKFGPIFEKTGGLPLPKRSPERQAYRLMELKRWREGTEHPAHGPTKYFPSDDAQATRLVIAAKLAGKDAHRCWKWERRDDVRRVHVKHGAGVDVRRHHLDPGGCDAPPDQLVAAPLPRACRPIRSRLECWVRVRGRRAREYRRRPAGPSRATDRSAKCAATRQWAAAVRRGARSLQTDLRPARRR